jgi:cell division septation protein DedD
MSDDSFREIQLNGKQLVFLFMAATVVFVVIFLCGVLVGRGVRPESLVAATEPVAAQPSEAPAVRASTETGPLAEAPPPAADGTLSYPERLDSNEDAKETLKPEGDRARPAPAPPAESRPATPAPAATPASTKPEAARPAAPPAGTPAAATEPPGTGFAVQIAAMSERSEAESIVQRLTSKGYSAYVLTPQSGGAGVYRVRVGKFKTRREAETMASRLEKEEQFKPWIIR